MKMRHLPDVIEPLGDEFWALYGGVQKSLFRYEGRQVYDLSHEGDLVDAFMDGDHSPVLPGRWDVLVQRHITAGRDVQRVRLVKEPWTDYTRWELHAFATNEAHGEEIRVLLAPNAHRVHGNDFLVVDEEVWAMDYNQDGVLLTLNLVPAGRAGTYEARRDRAMSESVPLRQYLAEARG